MTQNLLETKDYVSFLTEIKQDIHNSRIRAALSVNKELILLYWRIGHEILKRKKDLGWGSEVIKLLSEDLKREFPDIKGFGERNLVYMQTFASLYPDITFTQELPAQIPWYHNQTIMDKIKDPSLRIWYIQKTIENGWSRNILVMHIEAQSHLKLGQHRRIFYRHCQNPLPILRSNLLDLNTILNFSALLKKPMKR